MNITNLKLATRAVQVLLAAFGICILLEAFYMLPERTIYLIKNSVAMVIIATCVWAMLEINVAYEKERAK